MKKIFTLQTLILLIILILPVLAHADPDTIPGNPDSAPIDGGLSLLIAGGLGYSVKKLREKRKCSTDQ